MRRRGIFYTRLMSKKSDRLKTTWSFSTMLQNVIDSRPRMRINRFSRLYFEYRTSGTIHYVNANILRGSFLRANNDKSHGSLTLGITPYRHEQIRYDITDRL